MKKHARGVAKAPAEAAKGPGALTLAAAMAGGALLCAGVWWYHEPSPPAKPDSTHGAAAGASASAQQGAAAMRWPAAAQQPTPAPGAEAAAAAPAAAPPPRPALQPTTASASPGKQAGGLPPAAAPTLAQQTASAALLQAVLGAATPVSAQQPAPVNLRRNQRQGAAAAAETPAPVVAVDETGLPAYPHAVVAPEQSTRSAAGGVNSVSVSLLSNAGLAQVRNYYVEQLQRGQSGTRQVSVVESDNGLDLRVVDLEHRRVQRVVVATAGSQVVIQLSRAGTY